MHVPAHTETDREGNEVERPEHCRDQATTARARARPLENLAALKPAFKEDGTVTAGNACPLNDGAAALLIMSDGAGRAELGMKPARPDRRLDGRRASGPEVMGLGPIPAIQTLLADTGMTIADIDVVEINEAFAAQIVPCKDQLESPTRSSTRSAARSRSATRSG